MASNAARDGPSSRRAAPRHVFGRSTGPGGSGNLAPPTAIGVFHGIRAGLAYVFGSDNRDGRTIVVQGTGGIGSSLVERLAAAGATVLVTDIDVERARAVAARAGGTAVPGRTFSTKAMSPRRAQLLRTGGILYAPDYVIKGGGAIAPSRLGSTGFSIRTSGTDTPPVASSSRSSGRNPYAV
jgi:glutamate dehydrogenase/leucine dehydrogenase